MMIEMEPITKLDEIPGALQLFLALYDEPKYITLVLKRSSNPEGFISQTALYEATRELGEKGLGLIREETEEGSRPKTFLVITEKGKRVAQKLTEIQEILEE